VSGVSLLTSFKDISTMDSDTDTEIRSNSSSSSSDDDSVEYFEKSNEDFTITPYQFEPQRVTSNEEATDDDDEENITGNNEESRLGNSEWYVPPFDYKINFRFNM